MATLNMAETDELRKARDIIKRVAARIKNNPVDQMDLDALKSAAEKVDMVVTMKGHYPK